MSSASMQLASSSGLLSVAMFVVGAGLVTLLAGSFWLGARVKQRELPRPRPDEQPQLPPDGPVHEVRQYREPDEVPRTPKGGRALTPYQLTNMQTRPSTSKEPRRWSPGSSGSFGGGGLGGH
ncbi:DUF6479 family protein [Streptomyces phaeoluteigriseus]|uniref:DUF6479 family protein n=1 Tax=Streptomyces phaeoluteigriseus TaxID=114686 RepID=A0ABY4ZDY8_9ACTN|nr:DUF6479 family protein [Streptomyces phaeoluteigriseus]USQ86532.1 DUF6479 family protein [Streptomyces phaeoluteigriseus]